MLDEGHDLHPVDAVVERRLGHTALRRRIRIATARLLRGLGEERHLWLRLEELLGDCRGDREAAFFDIGYEHGRIAGRTEGLAEGKPRTAPAYRALVLRTREAAVNAGLPHTHAAAALIEATWSLVLDAKVRRRQRSVSCPPCATRTQLRLIACGATRGLRSRVFLTQPRAVRCSLRGRT